jgi:hypothetical protein
MGAESEKQKIQALIESTNADLLELVKSLTPQERAAKGDLKLWSAKDMVTHLNFWGRHFLNQLEKTSKGEKVPLAGDYLDQVNDGVLYEHIEQLLEEALAEFKSVHSELLEK